jgi:hypothetical protein
VIQYIKPAAQYTDTISDAIYPIICDVVISHDKGKETVIYVREAGKNPAIISSDDVSYYYGSSLPTSDGAMGLVNLVRSVGKKTPEGRGNEKK